MSLEEKLRLLATFDVLVRSNINGTAKTYAGRLRVSKSTFFRLLEYMRDELRAPITYDAAKGRYVYEKEGRLFLGFIPFEIISKENLKKIQEGSKPYMDGSTNVENIFARCQLAGLTSTMFDIRFSGRN